MKNLKILIVYPLYGGSLPIAEYCTQAFKDMGHTVDFFDAPAFNSTQTALKNLRVNNSRLNELENAFVNMLGEAIYAKAEAFKPDLVLALAQAPLTKQVLLRLRKNNIPTAMWFVEDYKLFTYWRAFAEFYDFFFVIQKGEFLDLLAQIPNTKAHYLPLAALPNLHKKQILSKDEEKYFGSDLSFLGAGYPNRRLAFRSLTKYNFKIWGSDWEEEAVLKKYIQNNGKRISVEESLKIYSATKININLHSSVQIEKLVSQGDFINPRTFELASIGAFQLVDKRSLLNEAFANELITFDSLEDLTQKIDYYLNKPEEREQLAKKAQELCHKKHTYQIRMQELLNFIQANTEDFGKKDNKQTILIELEKNTEISPELKTEIAELLAKYDLDLSASLNDLVERIKLNQGVLSPSESAILFLNEFKKQYLSSV